MISMRQAPQTLISLVAAISGVCLPQAASAVVLKGSDDRGVVHPLVAQQQLPGERFMQPEPEIKPLPRRSKPVLQQGPETAPPIRQSPADPSDPKISIREIRVVGSTVFKPSEWQALTAPLIGTSAGIGELRAVADAITRRYVEGGYITSQAVLGEQEIKDGVVRIQVVEGRLEKDGVKVNGAFRLHNYVKSRVALGVAAPLRVDRMEDQLILLRDDPLIDSIRARLLPGSDQGESVLEVTVKEADPLTTNLSADNFSPPILGSERYGGEIGYGNVSGLGDGFNVSYKHTNTTNSLWDLSYRLPLNAMNGAFEARAFLSRSQTTTSQDFNVINQGKLTTNSVDVTLRSDYDFYEASFRQPLIRTPRKEVAVSAGFAYRKGFPLEALDASGLPDQFANFVAGQGLEVGLQKLGLLAGDLNQDTTSVFTLGSDYLVRDPQGVWSLRSQFNIGTGLFDATTRRQPLPDGQFFSWLAQAQRLQRLWGDHLLILAADLQLSANPLLASEQFVIGGGPSVRGYQQNIRFGDNGYRFSAEQRIPILKAKSGRATLQLAPFVDLGQVWNNPKNPFPLPSQTFLIGVGAGLIWTPIPEIAVRLDAAPPLINLQDRGDNLQDNGLYFSVNIRPPR